jgi:hypothetical protein
VSRTHGIRATYTHGCRCPECTEAARVYADAARARRSRRPGDPRHGTGNGYTNWNCRCVECCQAYAPINAAQKARRKANA